MVRACVTGLVSVLGAWASAAWACQGERPESAQRVVRVFDFEERQINPDPVPRFWTRAQSDPEGKTRPGFPSYNAAELDYTRAAEGEGSVRLPTFGGSTSLLLDPGVIAVFPEVDYEVRALVRTEGLTHARAALVARFLDAAGRPVPGGERRSELVRSPGAWVPLRVEMLGVHPSAAFLQLELQLLQPERFEPAVHGPFQVWPGDVSGAAWFDSISVAQLPRIELSSPSPGAAWYFPDRPRLVADIRDLTGESLRAMIEVTDAAGRPVAREERAVGVGRARVEFVPNLPGLGWFAARLVVSNQRGAVGEARTQLAWLGAMEPVPEDPGRRRVFEALRRERARLGVVVESLSAETWGVLPALLEATGTGAVHLPLWDRSLTAGNAVGRSRDLALLIDVALADWRQATITIPLLPEELAAELSVTPGDVWALAESGGGSVAARWVDPFVDRLGQRISRWQIGALGGMPPVADRSLEERMGRLVENVLKLVSGATIVLPWHSEHAPPGVWWSASAGVSRGVSVLVPWQLPEASLGELLMAWSGGSGRATFVLESPPADSFTPHAVASQLVRRAVEVRAISDMEGPAADAAIVEPWRVMGDRRRAVVPEAALSAWHNLSERLAGRRVTDRLSIAPGVVCYVLAPAPGAPASVGGALVAWNRWADPEEAVLRLALGTDAAEVIDLWGNRSAAPMRRESATTAGGAVSRAVSDIRLGDAPVFVEGIDVDLVRFVASFRLDPPVLETTSRVREHRLMFENPWPTTLSGRYVIVEPGGIDRERGQRDRSWRITPRSAPFQAPAGGSVSLPITVAYGSAEEAGPRDFVVDVEVAAGRVYEPVRVRTRVHVGLDTMTLDLRALERAGGAAGVEATVTNTGSEAIDVELTALAPGRPRMKAAISGLIPGSSATRVFHLADAAGLRGQHVAVVITEPRSGGRLMRRVLIE